MTLNLEAIRRQIEKEANSKFIARMRALFKPTAGGAYSMAEMWRGCLEAVDRLEFSESRIAELEAEREDLRNQVARYERDCERLKKGCIG